MLFNPVDDRTQTMLAYEAAYYPNSKLGPQHKIVWSKLLALSKEQILEACDEEKNYLYQLSPTEYRKSETFRIHWRYNNIPTEEEWNRMLPYHHILVDFRISPVIAAGDGRIALLCPGVMVRDKTVRFATSRY